MLLNLPPTVANEPGWVAILGVLITWVMFYFAYARHRADMQHAQLENDQSQRTHDDDLERLAKRVIRDYVNSQEERDARDQRIAEVAAVVVNNEFSRRAVSFESAEASTLRYAEVNRRLDNLEKTISANTRELGNVAGQITTAVTTAVTTQLMAFLSTKIVAGRDDGT